MTESTYLEMCYLRYPSLLFYTREPGLEFCLLIVALIFYTLNKHSIMITNTWNGFSLDDKTVILVTCINKSKTFLPHLGVVIS